MGSVRGKMAVKNIGQLVQVCAGGETMICGRDQKVFTFPGGPAFVTVDKKGLIERIGRMSEYDNVIDDVSYDEVVDAEGHVMMAGLCDAHSHPVWAGERIGEFVMKLQGATYMQIHQAGGGIHFTVEKTREASEDQLYESLKQRLDSMIRHGTTLVECKSGYGLDFENELKMLRVIERARKDPDVKIDISTTYCGAHAVPKGMSGEEATRRIIEDDLPRISETMGSGEIRVDNIDVFCERGVFDLEQTRRILQAGVGIGLRINFHGDELHPMRSAEMGARLGAHAISHLEEISEEGIEEMGRSKSVAVLLPTTAYILRLPLPPAREMINAGVPIAFGSDFNPNAYCLSMPTVMHMGSVLLRMTLDESLIASTINTAASLGMSASHGSIEVGKRANFVILKTKRWEELIYRLSSENETIATVICGGEIAFDHNRHHH